MNKSTIDTIVCIIAIILGLYIAIFHKKYDRKIKEARASPFYFRVIEKISPIVILSVGSVFIFYGLAELLQKIMERKSITDIIKELIITDIIKELIFIIFGLLFVIFHKKLVRIATDPRYKPPPPFTRFEEKFGPIITLLVGLGIIFWGLSGLLGIVRMR